MEKEKQPKIRAGKRKRYTLVSFEPEFSGEEQKISRFKYKTPHQVCRLYYCVDDELGDDRGDL